MRPTPLFLLRVSLFFLSLSLIAGCGSRTLSKDVDSHELSSEEHEEYDGPALAAEQNFRMTKDPQLGRVPRDRYIRALQQTIDSRTMGTEGISAFGTWTERGPNTDAVGISNGNPRPNSDVTSGRMRGILVDANDATGNTVFVGGVNGGIWKTTNVNSSPATWTSVSDFFANMAITGICQNPATPNTMYFCTGEWTFNVDAAAGDGIWKSTNGGSTWSQLASTTSSTFDYCSKILCDASGNVYVATRSGVHRSIDGGTSWTAITPSGLATSRFSDMELSSTGRLHVSAGQFSTCAYRFTSTPSTVTSGTWTSPTAGYPASSVRIELACSGNTLYALPSDGTYEVPTVYKSTDGGANWAATTAQPTAGWANGQAWYSLAMDVDPANGNIAVLGGLEPYRTTDGGATWTKLANWVGVVGQYVHADIHFIKIYGTSSLRLLFGSDGGIFFSSDAGTTIRDRNVGLRLKQFYACAIHPSTTNYFLAGAQDNGVHQLTGAGLGGSTEVTGGDGAYVHIDQNEPLFQFGSYVFNQYRRSTNGGTTWSSVNLNASAGQFINPTDYDDAANIMYCATAAGNFRRWTNPQSGSTNANVNITSFNGNTLSAVKVSPYTSNRVYFGSENDVGSTALVAVDNANTIASGSAGTSISTGLPTNTYTSCIEVGSNDNNLVVTYSNYGVQQVWISTNGGTSWTNVDGNLPDMPVYWAMFKPGDDDRMILATETGVWFTQNLNGASTVWVSSSTFPTVRATMLQYRSSDNLVLASTHGRGLWTQNIFSILPLNNFMLRGKWNNTTTDLVWDFEESNSGGNFTVEYSFDGLNYNAGGNVNTITNQKTYNFTHQPGQDKVFYRIKHTSATGKILYSNVLKLFKGAGGGGFQITSLYPNPVQSDLKLAFVNTARGKVTYMITNMSGQVLWTSSEQLNYTGSNSRTWNQSALKAGSYIFTITNGSEKVSQKFVKQ